MTHSLAGADGGLNGSWVLGLFAWYGGLSGAAGADVVTTNNPRQDLLGLRQVW
jgi:hypothetical protein